MERPGSMVVGNDIDSKGLISHKIHIDYDQSNYIKTTNLSTYTPIENCYTPLTGSRLKSRRQSVNKHLNWVNAKCGN